MGVRLDGGSEASHLAPLRFADDDALRFYRWFRAIAPAENIALLTALDEPTLHSLQEI